MIFLSVASIRPSCWQNSWEGNGHAAFWVKRGVLDGLESDRHRSSLEGLIDRWLCCVVSFSPASHGCLSARWPNMQVECDVQRHEHCHGEGKNQSVRSQARASKRLSSAIPLQRLSHYTAAPQATPPASPGSALLLLAGSHIQQANPVTQAASICPRTHLCDRPARTAVPNKAEQAWSKQHARR
ncbi:hypothetical protein D3C73_932730 [compost metagenome]